MPPITIGREEGNSIQLNDDRVSRFHVKIQEDNRQLVLTDLESTNGTRVNGEAKMECVLQDGDVITFAGNRLVYRLEDAVSDHAPTEGETGAEV